MINPGLQLFGDKALAKKFKQLGDRVQRRVLRGAVNVATTPIVKSAKAKASKQSGLLRKSLGKKVKTYVDKNTVVGIVGPKTSTVGEYKGKKRRPANYAHLVEKGRIDEAGNAVPAKPFLRPAYDETEPQVLGTMRGKLAEGVMKEAKRK